MQATDFSLKRAHRKNKNWWCEKRTCSVQERNGWESKNTARIKPYEKKWVNMTENTTLVIEVETIKNGTEKNLIYKIYIICNI